MYRVVLDTNVYISALLRGRKPEIILRLSSPPFKRYDLFVSQAIFDEIDRVLREKFNWLPKDIDLEKSRIADWADVVKPTKQVSVIPPDRDDSDNRILECAVKVRADYIVSGDSHLLDLKEYEGIKIIPPAQFLKLLEK
ncbi:MAG: putative toxin-antitoxin system toxin component, PIN family [Actinomycetota bacterium]|nr:putative toxin-antitoxin system toxin component, PIN family [Actinomycetota bacterium]MDA8167145.1 putative toxin-antitoxin system toxin component, PIN family [Actinomycetota bacterium]